MAGTTGLEPATSAVQTSAQAGWEVVRTAWESQKVNSSPFSGTNRAPNTELILDQ